MTPCRHAIAVGAQKCATSWLYDVLATHPAIARADRKEVDFFSYHHDRGHGWYARQFGAGAVRIDASPSYFHDPRAPGRVAAHDRGARILIMLRDPVERAFSNHLHEIAQGHIAPMPFADALRDNPDYIEQGRYARHVGRWIDQFGPQVLCLLTEEVRADPGAALSLLCAFLGIDPAHDTGVLRETRNVSDVARNAGLRRVLRAGGAGLRRLGLEETLVRIKAAAPVAAVLRRNAVAVRDLVPDLTRQDRDAVLDHLADDLLALPALLGRSGLPWRAWQEARWRADAAPPPEAGQIWPAATNRCAARRPAIREPSGSGWVPSGDM